MLCSKYFTEISVLIWFTFLMENNDVMALDHKSKLSNKEIYENLKTSLKSIKESCGEICDQSITGKPNVYFQEIKKNVDCLALFKNSDIDNVSQFESPPMRIPKWLVPEYNYGGRVPITNFYRVASINYVLRIFGPSSPLSQPIYNRD